MNTSSPDPPRVAPNWRESHEIMFLAALDARLAHGNQTLKDRLRSAGRNAWRDYRLGQAMVEKSLDRIYTTLPVKTLKQMHQLALKGEVIVRATPACRTPEFQLVSETDLRMLVNTAMTAECAICMKTGGDVKACALRKALMRISPPENVHTDDCPYIIAVQKGEYGKYL